MSYQTKGPSSSSPTELSMKRKRGRPRKDESLVHGENNNIPAMAASDSAKKNRQSVSTSNGPSDDMVGQLVSGVIDGSFDAGYLLNVKVADTDTFLRGVVFLPGRFTPITATNDVAPHAKMYHRKEIPIPSLNSESQLHTADPLSEKSDQKKPVDLKNDSAKLAGQVQPTELLSGISVAVVAGEHQSAAVKTPSASNLLINNSGLSLGEKVVEQKIIESALQKDKDVGDNLVTGFSLGEMVLEQKIIESALEKDKDVGDNQVTGFSLGEKVLEQKIIESALEKEKDIGDNQVTGFSLGEKAMEQKTVESALKKDKAVEQDLVPPVFDIDLSLGEKVLEPKTIESSLKMDKAVGQDHVTQGFDTGLSPGEKVSGQETLESSLEKDASIKQNQVLQGLETFKLGEGPIIGVKLPREMGLPSIPYNLPGSEASNHQPQVELQTLGSDLKPGVLVHDNVKCPNFELNQIPAFTEPESDVCASTGLDMLMEKQASPIQEAFQDSHLELTKKVLSGDDTSHIDGIPLTDAVPTIVAGTYSAPMTSLPLMIFGAEHIASEPKPAVNDSALAKMVEPEVFSSPIDVNTSSMDCNVNDTIPPAQS